MSNYSVTSRPQGVGMQEGKCCYTAPTGNLSWVPTPRLSADGTDSPTSNTCRTFSSPPAARARCPAVGPLDGTVPSRSSLPAAAGNSIHGEWSSRQWSLSAARHCPSLDPPPTLSRQLSLRPSLDPLSLLQSKRKNTLDTRGVTPCGHADRATELRTRQLPCISEYWAGRMPDYFKAVRDRSLPDWDPDEEYQALLDFTYPLRPLSFTSRDVLGSEDLCAELSCLDVSEVLEDGSVSADHTLTTRSHLSSPAEPGCSGQLADQSWLLAKLAVPGSAPRLSSSPLPPAAPGSGPRRGEESRTQLADSPFTSTITSDCTLGNSVTDSGFLSKDSSEEFSLRPPSGDLSGGALPATAESDSEPEFLHLPRRLGQLDDLARQIHGLSARLDQSGPQTARLRDGDAEEGDDQRSLPHPRTTIAGDRGQLYHRLGTQSTNVQRCLTSDTIVELRRATDFIRKLGHWPRYDPDHHLNHDSFNNDGLLAHIQEFGGKLEEMVQWLYTVAETMDNWVPPLPDMGSIKSSLDVCTAFKNDVKEHQELTDSVLKSGEILLKSVVDTTPVLRETLQLIARQSNRLNGHAAHLYSSILTAMGMVKDDLQAKQLELEADGVERQLSLADDCKWH
ncbi:centrosomal protein of 68 kDa [Leucoraja erinacea]|uniref:centrosomal protein of 68 kDa n=1 Tax=Leucoraja erinaceus TaxID=7782 RepID=UPI0024587471|nr:centrosomal protein of 68 kDa [Leucoraja erinacea]XP_055494835.1 centrosomal protein of 68 kDa [Leucoraja erinacea]